MRFHGGRCLAGLFFLFVGWGCYQSIAPTPKITDTGTSSGSSGSSGGIIEPEVDGCSPRKPWDGPGITGILLPANVSNSAILLSGDRYFKVDMELRGADASSSALGRPTQWRESGHLSELWKDAPPDQGVTPWDEPGVTATYDDPGGGGSAVISRFHRWVLKGTDWLDHDTVVNDWLINDAGPPLIDGAAPWAPPSFVTATYFSPDNRTFFVIGQNKIWMRNTVGTPSNWNWPPDASFEMERSPMWSSAPQVNGQVPYQGRGVTAAWYIGTKLFVFSGDKMWTYDGTSWGAAGLVSKQEGWSTAPTAGCN